MFLRGHHADLLQAVFAAVRGCDRVALHGADALHVAVGSLEASLELARAPRQRLSESTGVFQLCLPSFGERLDMLIAPSLVMQQLEVDLIVASDLAGCIAVKNAWLRNSDHRGDQFRRFGQVRLLVLESSANLRLRD